MNEIAERSAEEWTDLVTAALTSLKHVTPPTRPVTWFTYSPEPIDGAEYRITPPQVIAAPDAGRLVVRFTMTNYEGIVRKFEMEAVVVFDGNLNLVPDETRTAVSANLSTSPFFNSALVPQPLVRFAAPIVNTLAIAALGVGILSSLISSRRLTPPQDNDASLRLLPHYGNRLINQIHMAMQVARRGGGAPHVKRVTELGVDLKKRILHWPEAKPWRAPNGSVLEKAHGGEVIRLWRPTVAALDGTYALVLKIDRVLKQRSDDHVLITMVFRRNGAVLSVTGDAYFPSGDTTFAISKTATGPKDNPLVPWIHELRARSVQAGLGALEFSTGAGQLLAGLAAYIRTLPLLEVVKIT